MISQVLQLTLKPGVAGEANKLLKRNLTMLKASAPGQILVLENRNRRSVMVIATFKDKESLDAFAAQTHLEGVLPEFLKLSSGHLDFYEAITEIM